MSRNTRATATTTVTQSARQRAQVLGILLGARQAEDHYLGGVALDDQALTTLACLAWKYEALPQLDDTQEHDAFVQAYRAAYRFAPAAVA